MSRLPSILLYLGPEEGLRSEELDALRARIGKTLGAPPEEHRVYLPDGDVRTAIGILQNGSLFSSHCLVILAGAEQIRKKEDVAAVAAYCSSPPEGATLVLVSDAVRLDSKLEKAVPSDARKVFWELFENQKRGWVAAHVRKRGVSLSPDALELFLDLVENNTRELRAEADKLCIFALGRANREGGRPELDVDDVETFVYHSREESVFSLYQQVVDDDFAGALEVMAKLDSSGEGGPVQLIAGLVFQVRKLLALRTLLDGRVSEQEAFTKLAIRGKRIQADYRTAVRRYSRTDLERQLSVLIAYDAAFRELGSGMQRILLDLLVYQLMFESESLTVEEALDASIVG